MPVSWTIEADRKLLMAIIELNKVSVNTEAISNKLKLQGLESCTPVAVQRRFQRIRELIKDGSGSPGGTPKTKSPAKRKSSAESASNKELETPTKKSKMLHARKPLKKGDRDLNSQANENQEEMLDNLSVIKVESTVGDGL